MYCEARVWSEEGEEAYEASPHNNISPAAPDKVSSTADDEALVVSEAIEVIATAQGASNTAPGAPQQLPPAVVPARRARSPGAKSPPRQKKKTTRKPAGGAKAPKSTMLTGWLVKK